MSARNNPVLLTGPTRGLDGRGWISKARDPIISDGRIGDMWFNTLTHYGFGPKTAGGWGAGTYLRGPHGWTALTRVVIDGTRRVREIYDWIGGEGTKPATGYEGATGTVPDIEDAVDYRGAEGPQALINALDAKADSVTYETLTALAESASDNEKAAVKRIFEAGGSMPCRSRAEAQATIVPAAVKSVATQFFAPLYADLATIVGGSNYRRVDSEPTHDAKLRTLDRWTSEGNHDSANGGWWEDASPRITPDALGAKLYKSPSLAAAGGDSAAAVKKAFLVGRPVVLNGYYRCDEAIELADVALDLSPTVGAAGLVFTNASGGGITIVQSSQTLKVRIQGVDLLTNQAEPGHAIKIDYSAASDMVLSRNQRTVILKDGAIRGIDFLASGWTQGVVLDEVQAPVLRDLFITGRRNSAAVGEERWWPGMTDGVLFTSSQNRSPTDPLFSNVEVAYAQIAFHNLGVLEGVRYESCIAVACRDGIIDDRREVSGPPTSDPWLSVHHCHLNVGRAAIESIYCYQGFVDHNLIYRFLGSRVGDDLINLTWKGISLSRGNDWKIDNNHITGNSNIAGVTEPSYGLHLVQGNHAKVHHNSVLSCTTPGFISGGGTSVVNSRLQDNEAFDSAGNIVPFWTYDGDASKYSNPEANNVGIIAEGSNTVSGAVNLGGLTTLATISLNDDTYPVGSVFRVFAQAVMTKGATAGASRLLLNKLAGTATIAAGYDGTTVDAMNDSHANGQIWAAQLNGIFRKVTAGSLSDAIRASSSGSNADIAAGGFQYVIERIR